MKKWVDTTSRSKEDKGPPRAWTLGEGHRASVTVLRHMSAPDAWSLTCYDLDLVTIPLSSVELEDAKKEALKLVSKRLATMVKYYKKIGVETP